MLIVDQRIEALVGPGSARHIEPPATAVVDRSPDRCTVIARICRAPAETGIRGRGVATTAESPHDILHHPRYRAANHGTALIGPLTTVSRVAS
ncbi:hypothetical protein [Nocardia sp. R6R-6]|uniref:hypothetical protein n=1 Tax=Nocardia sp. R6R-6 TaxID=3459303 RepID=UPI00403E2495